MLATQVPYEVLADVIPPWPAFQIDVPDGLLCGAEDAEERDVKTIFVAQGDDRWSYLVTRADDTVSGRQDVRADEMVRESLSNETTPGDPFPANVDAEDRLLAMIGRLIVGVCLELSSPNVDVKRVGRGHGDWERRTKRGSPLPIGPRIFRLGRDVKIDVRRAVRDYIRGGGSSPTVQSLIRGHWKLQAHGPRHSLRKRIHVEPYWRGPEDGPVLIRAVSLREVA